MAAEAEADAESVLARFEELLRRAGGDERREIGFFPVVFAVVGAPAAEGAAPGLERVVMLNPLTRGVVILQGDPALLSELISPEPAAGGGGPPPASKASIEALRTVEPGEEDAGEECPVCLDGLGGGRGAASDEGAVPPSVREMPCRHRFHGGCIEKWLGMHGSCPVCRYQMPAEEGEPKTIGDAGRERTRELIITVAFGRRDEGINEQ
ncbi:unnamed protein product [Musa hybrid cultivar]